MSIDFDRQLNPAQLDAVRTTDGPVLVIAGAGSGKTRTIVYRLAWLAGLGVAPESILLLTFTRKASAEMIERAGSILGRGMAGVQGGTFHGFAYKILRQRPPSGYDKTPTIVDRPDAESILRECKSRLGLGKGDRSYPKVATILDYLSKSRNKEVDLPSTLGRDAPHLLPYASDIEKLGAIYTDAKRTQGFFDYDDLLFEFERLLVEEPEVRQSLAARFSHVMVDEYQDTNRVQARLVKLLVGESGNIMAVGDDAQSIYSFRGADVRNILDFPKDFPGAKIVKLEENYRSTKPVLDLANRVFDTAAEHWRKELFTHKPGGERPKLVRPLSDAAQAKLAADAVKTMLKDLPAREIAVLFRAGYMSYAVELELNKRGVPFVKYGGLRYAEASHVKDLLAYLRAAKNPMDFPAFMRILGHVPGVGEKTAHTIHTLVLTQDAKGLNAQLKKKPGLGELFVFLDDLASDDSKPTGLLEKCLAFYEPLLSGLFPDDHPRRKQGLEQLVGLAADYDDVQTFLADLTLDSPDERERREDAVTLSTIHSAKGLEWSAVCILDLVEDRFPSSRSLLKPEDFEEERRLFYVAATRAKEQLILYVPATVFKRGREWAEPTIESPFVRDLPKSCFDEYREARTGGLIGAKRPDCAPVASSAPLTRFSPSEAAHGAPSCLKETGWCRHKLFGRGKIIGASPPDKYRVNFPGLGVKVILAAYLEIE